MTFENAPPPVIEEEISEPTIPWSLREILFSLGAAILLSLGVVGIAFQWPKTSNFVMIIYELAYLIPVIMVLLIKKANFRILGFRSFKVEDLAIGCGFLFGTYLIIMVHNLLLMGLGVTLQGEYIEEFFKADEGVGLLAFVGIIIAPLAEEIFFRGFVFGGLQQKYGWKTAAIFSSALFALAHMQLAVLIPTFLLGFVFAYLFHRTKSIWPGIILHFVVNSFAFGSLYLLSFLEGYL